MKISIFGLGYVGVVTAACLARDGCNVIGVDISPHKVALVNNGKSPIVEPGLKDLLDRGVKAGRIQATVNAEAAILASDISLISVGTPPIAWGEPDLSYVFGVCKEIAVAVERKATRHLVVLRSTVPPGTLEKCQHIFDEVAGKNAIHTAFNPEFLREGTAIKDYDCPPYTIIGTQSSFAETTLRKIYANLKAPLLVTKPEVSEMVKFVANTWHAAKVSFANEIGRVADAFGIDGREVMDVIVQDKKLNISPVYMRPGFAYGGSCLPKDLGALLYLARKMDVPVPLLDTIPITNVLQIDLAVRAVLSSKARRIAILGLAFKPNTDDLRESPAVILVKRLLGEGCALKIYDRAVYQARLVGNNLAYIEQNLPHFEALLVSSPEEALEGAELVVATHNTNEFRQLLDKASLNTPILDLAGVLNLEDSTHKLQKQLVA